MKSYLFILLALAVFKTNTSFAGAAFVENKCLTGNVVSFDRETVTIENGKMNFIAKFKNLQAGPRSIVPENGKVITFCSQPIFKKKIR
jgi:hypothetical protein